VSSGIESHRSECKVGAAEEEEEEDADAPTSYKRERHTDFSSTQARSIAARSMALQSSSPSTET